MLKIGVSIRLEECYLLLTTYRKHYDLSVVEYFFLDIHDLSTVLHTLRYVNFLGINPYGSDRIP